MGGESFLSGPLQGGRRGRPRGQPMLKGGFPSMPKGQHLKMDVETQVQCVLEGLAGTPAGELCHR